MTTAFGSRQTLSTLFFYGISVLTPALAPAQNNTTTATPGPDTLILVDGEKLIGHLLRSTGDSVMFHSDIVGDVIVNWSKIEQLKSNQNFAVVEKGLKLRTNESDAKIPQGSVTLEDGNLSVLSTGQNTLLTLPLGQIADVI